MAQLGLGTRCVQAGYSPKNGEPRQIPIVQSICENGDNGTPEVLNDGSQTGQAFMAFARRVVEETGRRNAEQAPTKIVEVKK